MRVWERVKAWWSVYIDDPLKAEDPPEVMTEDELLKLFAAEREEEW